MIKDFHFAFPFGMEPVIYVGPILLRFVFKIFLTEKLIAVIEIFPHAEISTF